MENSNGAATDAGGEGEPDGGERDTAATGRAEEPDRPVADGRPRSRSQSKIWTREQVMRSAEREFAERGYAGASITHIAAVAGVAVGSVYVHFANKSALFWAVLNQRLEAEQRNASAALEADLVSFVESYGRLLDTGENEQSVVLQAETWLHSLRDPSFRDEMAQHQRQVRAMVARLVALLRGGAAPGTDWVFSDEQIATLATTLYRGFSQARRVETEEAFGELFSATIVNLLQLSRPADEGR